jgi:type I restriction enzyme S subunit
VSWKTVALGDVCEMYQPKTITSKELVVDGEYFVYGANGIIGKYSSFNHEQSQLVIGCRGSVGSVHMTKPKSWITGNAMVVNPKINDINLRFLEYFFRGAVDLSKAITGAAQPQITRTSLSPINFSYPSISVQQEIVAKLDVIFAEIDKATAAAEANAKNSEALFQSYLAQVFERNGLGVYSKTIGDVCSLRSGTTVSPSLEKTEGELPYLKVADMNLLLNQNSITTSSRFLNKSDINSNSIIRKGSTIFPKRGGAIDTNKKRITDIDIALDLNVMSVYPGEQLNPKLLYFFFLGLDMRKLGSGSSIRQINNYDIEPIVVNYPSSLDEQEALVKLISTLKDYTDKLISNYKQKKLEMDFIRHSILKKAFNGELVKE